MYFQISSLSPSPSSESSLLSSPLFKQQRGSPMDVETVMGVVQPPWSVSVPFGIRD